MNLNTLKNFDWKANLPLLMIIFGSVGLVGLFAPAFLFVVAFLVCCAFIYASWVKFWHNQMVKARKQNDGDRNFKVDFCEFIAYGFVWCAVFLTAYVTFLVAFPIPTLVVSVCVVLLLLALGWKNHCDQEKDVK